MVSWATKCPPATFGWLCVETHKECDRHRPYLIQPPSGGCVLKPPCMGFLSVISDQPPSGGCVLKHCAIAAFVKRRIPATFGWLCVETTACCRLLILTDPATFGWLCVETIKVARYSATLMAQPPSGGCVLKRLVFCIRHRKISPATFGWLCVETTYLY